MDRERIQEVQNFINVLEGETLHMSGETTLVKNGDLYWGKTDKPLDLYSMYEIQLLDLQDELAVYVLPYLEKTYIGKEINLKQFDDEMRKVVSKASSIFDYDVREMLENSFCYQYAYENIEEGFNVDFKIVKDSENVLDIIVKIVDIRDI